VEEHQEVHENLHFLSAAMGRWAQYSRGRRNQHLKFVKTFDDFLSCEKRVMLHSIGRIAHA
jgi:hypothetical protein